MRLGIGLALGSLGAPAWSPANLGSNVAMWLDAAQGVTLVSSRVQSWTDQGPLANSPVAAAAGQRPHFTASAVDGRPGVFLDANSTDAMFVDSLAASFSGDDQPMQVFVVGRLETTLDNTGAVLGFESGGTGAMWLRMVTTSTHTMLARRVQDAGGGVNVTTTDVATLTARIISFEFTGTAMTIRINGVPTSVNGTALNLGPVTLTKCTIGAASSGFNESIYLTICEMVVCKASLITAERNLLLTYFHSKFPSIPVTLS